MNTPIIYEDERKFRLALRWCRQEKKWSMAELGRRAGVAHSEISMVESGRRKSPGVRIIQRLAKALEITVVI